VIKDIKYIYNQSTNNKKNIESILKITIIIIFFLFNVSILTNSTEVNETKVDGFKETPIFYP